MRRRGRDPGRCAQGSLAAFAFVMATAIVSVATESHAATASFLLLWFATGAFVVLAARVVVEVITCRDRLIAELRQPCTAFDSLTIVAAAGVLSTRFSADRRPSEVGVLAAVTAVTWLALAALVSSALIANRRGLYGQLSGNWLLAVVATQSVAAAAASIARSWNDHVLSTIGLAAWIVGVTLYGILLAPLSLRLRSLAAQRRFTPDYWIAMGALAITTLAAAALLRAPDMPVRSLIRIGGLATWVGAGMWIPVLVVADGRALTSSRFRPPSQARWSMVFPLGMLSASAQAYGRVEAAPLVTHIGDWAMWGALAAWAMVAIGTSLNAAAGCNRPLDQPKMPHRRRERIGV